jgi:hypothetical protein
MDWPVHVPSIHPSTHPPIHFPLTMAGQAQITSVEALEAFRADLIVYLSQMRPVIDEVASELMRTKFWLQNEQRQVLENQARRQQRRLEEAQAELFNARLSTLQESTILQTMAVQKNQRAAQETERKLGLLKKWDRELENLAGPLLKPVDQLRGFLATDMEKAVAFLNQAIQALEAYRKVAPPAAPNAVGAPADDTKATP